MIVYLSLLVCIVGLLVFALAKSPPNGDVKELGKLAFFAGLLAFLLRVSEAAFRIIP